MIIKRINFLGGNISFLVGLVLLIPGCKDCLEADFDIQSTSLIAPATLKFALTSEDYTYNSWDFGDNNTITNESRPEHTYQLPGTYTVKLTVGNNKKKCDEVVVVKTITIVAAPTTVADFVVNQPMNCNPPCTILFSNTSQNATSYSWSFGVGGNTSAESNPSFTYQSIGTYTVVLTAQGPGGISTKSQTISVPNSNVQTVADFSVAQSPNCIAPCNVSFSNLSQNATTYLWDFGVLGAMSTEQNPNYTYQLAGTYTVKLTAQGTSGPSTKTSIINIPVPGGQPNLNFGTAYDLQSDQTVSGQFTSSEDRYYKLNFPSSCVVRILVTNAASKFRIKVYDEAVSTSLVYTSPWIEKGTSVAYIAGPLGQGSHYFVADPYSSVGDPFNFVLNQDCTDSTEPNNSFDKATPLLVGQEANGKILAINDSYLYEDLDMYRFTVSNKPAIATVRFVSPGAIVPAGDYFRFKVYNEANYATELEYKNVYAGEAGEIKVGPLSVGEHFIAINNNNSLGLCHCQSEGNYTIRVNLDYRDVNEPNDVPFENATILTLETATQGMIAYPNGSGNTDIDWFKLTPQQSGNYRIELTALPIATNTRVYVYDDPGSAYLSYFYQKNGLFSSDDLSLIGGNDYWIKIDLGSSSAESDGLYTLKATKL